MASPAEENSQLIAGIAESASPHAVIDPDAVDQLQRTARIFGSIGISLSVVVLVVSIQLLVAGIAFTTMMYFSALQQRAEGVQPTPDNPFVRSAWVLGALALGVIAGRIGLFYGESVFRQRMWAIRLAVAFTNFAIVALIAGAAYYVRSFGGAALVVAFVLGLFLLLMQGRRGLQAARLLARTLQGLDVQFCRNCQTAFAVDRSRCPNCSDRVTDRSEMPEILSVSAGIICAIIAGLLLMLAMMLGRGYFGICLVIPILILYIVIEIPALIMITAGLLKHAGRT